MRPNGKRIAVVVLVVGLAAAGIWFWQRSRTGTQGSDRVTANGTIEPDEVENGAQRAARLAQYRVEEGQPVRRGQVIATLDRSELEAQLAQAQGAERRAAARLAELLRGTRQEKIQQ